MDPEVRIKLQKAGIQLVWFDSLGAKSMCVFVRDGIIIDPGAAAMQPSYPLTHEEKLELRKKALNKIKSYLRRSHTVIVTHYHYDHIINLNDPTVREPSLFLGRHLYLKNPNKYINESQWKRSRDFISVIAEAAGSSITDLLTEPKETEFPDPLDELHHALSVKFGDYESRRQELLNKGRKWFVRLKEKLWSIGPWVKEANLPDGTRIEWGEGKTVQAENTIIKILGPWFHGVEYDRTGWVTPVFLETSNVRVFITSDLMGPPIEDYADEIISAKPDVVILDGPPTYLFPYMLNRVNLRRSISNAARLIEEARPSLII